MSSQRTRRCPKCNQQLTLDNFRKRTSTGTPSERKRIGQPYGNCRSCQRARDLERRSTLEGYLENLSNNIRGRSRRIGVDFDLTPQVLKAMHHNQSGLCAVTGQPLTTIIGKGTVKTNISADRIIVGGPYTQANTRLVCQVVNIMRNTLSDEDLNEWCSHILSGRRPND